VYLSHVLEHLTNPLLALNEIERVTKKKVVIKVPNASYYRFRASSHNHIFSWNYFTFKNLLECVFDKVEVFSSKKYTQRNYLKKIIFVIGCLFLSDNELTALCDLNFETAP
jgi:ubiquinone/menaquinone biosynthesis C-methylase UbiE